MLLLLYSIVPTQSHNDQITMSLYEYVPHYTVKY